MRFLPLLAQLEIKKSEIGYNSNISNADTGLGNILNLVYFWAGMLAVLVLVIAGLLFVTSRGDASQMKRSKDAIRGAVTGLIIIIAAFAITRFVIGGIQ